MQTTLFLKPKNMIFHLYDDYDDLFNKVHATDELFKEIKDYEPALEVIKPLLGFDEVRDETKWKITFKKLVQQRGQVWVKVVEEDNKKILVWAYDEDALMMDDLI